MLILKAHSHLPRRSRGGMHTKLSFLAVVESSQRQIVKQISPAAPVLNVIIKQSTYNNEKLNWPQIGLGIHMFLCCEMVLSKVKGAPKAFWWLFESFYNNMLQECKCSEFKTNENFKNWSRNEMMLSNYFRPAPHSTPLPQGCNPLWHSFLHGCLFVTQ